MMLRLASQEAYHRFSYAKRPKTQLKTRGILSRVKLNNLGMFLKKSRPAEPSSELEQEEFRYQEYN